MKSSVIIPTAGRPVVIKTAIQSLLAASPDRHSAEILVIDNNTQEELARDLHEYCTSLNGRVRYVRETSPGLSAARHRGVDESHGEILTFIDDDVEVSGGWLNAIQRSFEDPHVGMVGGPSIPKFTDSIPAWLLGFCSCTPHGGWMCSWLSLLDIGKSVKGISPNFVWGLNFSIRRSVIEDCGGFHPDLVPSHLQRWQGDGETGLTMKVEAAGFRADYVHEALLLHVCGSDRLNPQYFAKRAFYQGVCASFTRIRAGQDPKPNSAPHENQSILQKCRAMAERALHRFQGRGSHWVKDAAAVGEAMDAAHLAGWRFHQREVAGDSRLLSWVRRADFRNADIREEIGSER